MNVKTFAYEIAACSQIDEASWNKIYNINVDYQLWSVIIVTALCMDYPDAVISRGFANKFCY